MFRDPFERTGPIVTSLADDDFYKLSMLGLTGANPQMRNAEVVFAMKNRTTRVALAQYVKESDLRRELNHVLTLKFDPSALRYIGGHFASEQTPSGEMNRRMFNQEFINDLAGYQLAPYHLVREINDTYTLRTRGPWFNTTLWEIHCLQIMAELYFESLMSKLSRFERQCLWAQAQQRLLEKIRILKRHPGVTIVDFATRRRACLAWQRYVNKVLLEELGPKQFRGTSNVMLSMENHTIPMGTFAHEEIMGMSGIMHGSNDDIRDSQNSFFDLWFAHYGQPLSIALSDTYGTDFFLRTFGADRARLWKGTRQDSGDPFAYGEKMIEFYRGLEIDPKSKLIIFSDGLDVDTIVELHNRFSDRINVTFGWGTNLTNDFGPGFEPLSLVMKLMECNGHHTVKLSDNLAKAMGHPEDIERFKRIFGYTGKTFIEPRY